MEEEKKYYYTAEDIMKRYDVGLARAQQIMREAQALHAYPGGKLGKGKLLPSELDLWEHHLPPVMAPSQGYR